MNDWYEDSWDRNVIKQYLEQMGCEDIEFNATEGKGFASGVWDISWTCFGRQFFGGVERRGWDAWKSEFEFKYNDVHIPPRKFINGDKYDIYFVINQGGTCILWTTRDKVKKAHDEVRFEEKISRTGPKAGTLEKFCKVQLKDWNLTKKINGIWKK